MDDLCIIIPTFNREENLRSSLNSNLSVFSQVRVFIIDASEKPFLINHSNISVIPAKEKGQSRQKFQGAQLAKDQGYSWIVFLDDDIFLEDDFLLSLETYLEMVPVDFHAASFQIKNHWAAKSIRNLILNFSQKGGLLLSSTYTTPLNGSMFNVQWCNGGAVIWKVEAFMNLSRDYDIAGKAICEDIYSCSHYGLSGYYFFKKCIVAEYDKSSCNRVGSEMFDYASHEFSARLHLIELRPTIFKKSHFFYHACWRAFIFTVFGVATLSQKRFSYGIGLGFSIINYIAKFNGKNKKF